MNKRQTERKKKERTKERERDNSSSYYTQTIRALKLHSKYKLAVGVMCDVVLSSCPMYTNSLK